jgi:hypothetical protein
MIGGAVALSFIFNTNLSGTYSYALTDSTASRTFLGTFAATANTPVRVTVLIPAIPAAASIPNSTNAGLILRVGALNQGTYQGAASGAWQSANYVAASGATNWAATANNFIELTDLQLEPGSIATPFDRRSYGHELSLCQRYFATEVFGFIGAAYSSGSYVGNFFCLPVTMRAAPTVVIGSVLENSNLSGGTPSLTIWSNRIIRIWAQGAAAGQMVYDAGFTASAEL